ncbi:dexamethasone-induced Ras-related protein 1-like, partial [Anneissia japonica]|uniref:dexamethasone-induced Ras-related protein 1-like n=1 Tax=Anneissia japonica TaxID=1529436 RepID=UPI0014256828
DVFILAYSIDNRDTYHEVLRLRENIVDTFRANKGIKAVPMVIAGNKSDHPNREITTEEAKKAFSYKRCSFVETSAKKNLHIDTLFRHLFENARMPSEMSPSLHRK